jgi:hypothetical protein
MNARDLVWDTTSLPIKDKAVTLATQHQIQYHNYLQQSRCHPVQDEASVFSEMLAHIKQEQCLYCFIQKRRYGNGMSARQKCIGSGTA